MPILKLIGNRMELKRDFCSSLFPKNLSLRAKFHQSITIISFHFQLQCTKADFEEIGDDRVLSNMNSYFYHSSESEEVLANISSIDVKKLQGTLSPSVL